jgi:hypothetical protein
LLTLTAHLCFEMLWLFLKHYKLKMESLVSSKSLAYSLKMLHIAGTLPMKLEERTLLFETKF